jgi:prepilin signal peptidase PulO-like enzyme (type II secretory pathway)
MAVAGVMMVFLPWKQRNLLQMVLSIIGFLALLALIVLFRQQYADLGSNSGSEYQEKLLKGLNFKIEAGLGLIWSMVLFAVNGLFLGSCMYIQKQYANEEKVPDALQNVDNESANQLNV